MSDKTKGLILISNVTKAMEHEWFVEFAVKDKMDLEFILFNSKNSELYQFIVGHGFKCTNYSLSSKFFIPFYIKILSIKLIFKRYDFVHCHLFEASIIGSIASRVAGVRKRIHTRHHGDFHHVYFPNAIKYDRLVNYLSTHIIAVSSNIKQILLEKENVPEEKVTVIPHGIPLAVIDKEIPQSEIDTIKDKYYLRGNFPVVGVISRFTEWKGIQYIIPAFKKLLIEYPKAKLVLANASGDYEKEINSLLSDLPANSYIVLKFEKSVNPLFKSFDVFVHAPIDNLCEAFGQVYIEALSLEVPMVCTLSGIACEFIENEKNAVVAEYKNSDSIYLGITKVISDKILREKIVRQGKLDVKEYTFEKKFLKLKSIYQS